MTQATGADFREVINSLNSPDEYQHLFHQLDISERDISMAEADANTNDPELKARNVLVTWRRTKGTDATCEALLDAKEKVTEKRTLNKGRSYITVI